MTTVGQSLDRFSGFGPGFDFARIGLAISILAFHSVVVVGQLDHFYHTAGWIVPCILVPMFFAVSGFLITASGMRLNLREFLLNRALRIIPALAVEIVLSAFVIGALFTTLPLGSYFSSSGFWKYFLNVVGIIQYQLPGVFETNPSSVVNQSLWTIPYEILCYAVMSVLILTGCLKHRYVLLAVAIAYFLIGTALGYWVPPDHRTKIITSLFFGRGSLAFECFLAGILLYLFRFHIVLDARLAIAFAVVVSGISLAGNESWAGSGFLNLLLCPMLAYIIIFIGLTPMPAVPVYSRGDYSYGVYLYGYPVQQSVLASLGVPQAWATNFILSLVASTLWAMVSWHMVEKPILKMRRKFSFVGRRIDEETGNAPQAPYLERPSNAN